MNRNEENKSKHSTLKKIAIGAATAAAAGGAVGLRRQVIKHHGGAWNITGQGKYGRVYRTARPGMYRDAVQSVVDKGKGVVADGARYVKNAAQRVERRATVKAPKRPRGNPNDPMTGTKFWEDAPKKTPKGAPKGGKKRELPPEDGFGQFLFKNQRDASASVPVVRDLGELLTVCRELAAPQGDREKIQKLRKAEATGAAAGSYTGGAMYGGLAGALLGGNKRSVVAGAGAGIAARLALRKKINRLNQQAQNDAGAGGDMAHRKAQGWNGVVPLGGLAAVGGSTAGQHYAPQIQEGVRKVKKMFKGKPRLALPAPRGFGTLLEQLREFDLQVNDRGEYPWQQYGRERRNKRIGAAVGAAGVVGAGAMLHAGVKRAGGYGVLTDRFRKTQSVGAGRAINRGVAPTAAWAGSTAKGVGVVGQNVGRGVKDVAKSFLAKLRSRFPRPGVA
jgi:hypothetical protein